METKKLYEVQAFFKGKDMESVIDLGGPIAVFAEGPLEALSSFPGITDVVGELIADEVDVRGEDHSATTKRVNGLFFEATAMLPRILSILRSFTRDQQDAILFEISGKYPLTDIRRKLYGDEDPLVMFSDRLESIKRVQSIDSRFKE